MSLVTTHVAKATSAIWLTVFFFLSGYYQHSANLSSGQSYPSAGVICCVTAFSLTSYPGSVLHV